MPWRIRRNRSLGNSPLILSISSIILSVPPAPSPILSPSTCCHPQYYYLPAPPKDSSTTTVPPLQTTNSSPPCAAQPSHNSQWELFKIQICHWSFQDHLRAFKRPPPVAKVMIIFLQEFCSALCSGPSQSLCILAFFQSLLITPLLSRREHFNMLFPLATMLFLLSFSYSTPSNPSWNVTSPRKAFPSHLYVKSSFYDHWEHCVRIRHLPLSISCAYLCITWLIGLLPKPISSGTRAGLVPVVAVWSILNRVSSTHHELSVYLLSQIILISRGLQQLVQFMMIHI